MMSSSKDLPMTHYHQMTSFIIDNLWTMLCNSKTFNRELFACDVYQDRHILVAGGNLHYGMDIQSAAMYDTETKTHVTLPDLPCGPFCREVVVNGYFYVVEIDRTLQTNGMEVNCQMRGA